MRNTKSVASLAAITAGLALAVVGCGGSSGTASSSELDGMTFKVGSKEFTEQKILGAIAIRALEDAGAKVTDETGIEGTANVRKALESGQIDMYWEYTGTGFIDILGNTTADAPGDPQELFDAVATADAKNGISWIDKSEANDTYAFAASQETVDATGVKTISDLAALASSDPSSATLCAAAEFLDRADGFPGVEKAYGFTIPDSAITELDLNIIYTELPKGDKCKFGEVFESAGQIPANDLAVLEDDKKFFPGYQVAMTIDSAVLKESPKVESILQPIADKLTTEDLQAMNAQVDVDGLPEDAVAEKWLKDNGLIG